MVFSSIIFVFAFLPLTLIFYFIAEKTGKMCFKNTVVLIASLVFYAWGGLKYLFLLAGLVVVNYVSGVLMERVPKHKTLFLTLGLLVDLLSLIFFKYLNFIVENLENVLQLFGNPELSFGLPEIIMPIGISFFTFQIMSYLIDVYKGDVPAQKNIAWLALYIMMFPQLIAGPIVRYSDVNEEIASRTTNIEMAEKGVKRFIVGFAKKVFVANCMGAIADTLFALNGTENMVYSWLGIIAYALQIFYDFSAYSDMAIGLGLIFGFHFNENFNYPYIAKSVQEFWKRWHISLSTWFRDYLYIPLGGNRRGKYRTYLNLAIVFLVTGIWHGAAWQFLVWGVLHGIFMLIERAGFGKVLRKIPAVFSRLYTLVVVLVAWVFFRADNLSHALKYIKNMFSFNFSDFGNVQVLSRFNNLFFIVGIIALLATTPIFKRLGESKLGKIEWLSRSCYILLFVISIVYLSGLTYNPFIYFKF